MNDLNAENPASEWCHPLSADALRKSLSRNLRVLGLYLICVATFPFAACTRLAVPPISGDHIPWLIVYVAFGVFLVVTGVVVRRGLLWPVLPVLVIACILGVVLCVWITPTAAILFCGVPVLCGYSVLLRERQLGKAGERLFD